MNVMDKVIVRAPNYYGVGVISEVHPTKNGPNLCNLINLEPETSVTLYYETDLTPYEAPNNFPFPAGDGWVKRAAVVGGKTYWQHRGSGDWKKTGGEAPVEFRRHLNEAY